MKDWFEAHSKVSNFERIVLFNTLRQHSQALPVVFGEKTVVEGIQRRTLSITKHNIRKITLFPQTSVEMS